MPEFSMVLDSGNTVLVMGLNFRGVPTNDKCGKFSFRVKLNFCESANPILSLVGKVEFWSWDCISAEVCNPNSI